MGSQVIISVCGQSPRQLFSTTATYCLSRSRLPMFNPCRAFSNCPSGDSKKSIGNFVSPTMPPSSRPRTTGTRSQEQLRAASRRRRSRDSSTSTAAVGRIRLPSRRIGRGIFRLPVSAPLCCPTCPSRCGITSSPAIGFPSLMSGSFPVNSAGRNHLLKSMNIVLTNSGLLPAMLYSSMTKSPISARLRHSGSPVSCFKIQPLHSVRLRGASTCPFRPRN